MINFPAAPNPGDTFTSAGVTWTWDGSKWTGNGLAEAYLPLIGGTMQGPLTLAGNPVKPLDAATKQYVDAPFAFSHDNRIINGDMWNDQRNKGASGTVLATTNYWVDRWAYGVSQSSKLTGGRNLNSVPGPAGFSSYFGTQSSSTYSVLANDYFQILQNVEADMVSDFAWGTANAQSVTLSFWASSSLTGTFSGCIKNAAATRSYPFTYSISAANTWTRISVTIPGDTAGTWVMSGNGAGLSVVFDLGTGATYRGPANAWASANYVGVTGTVSVVGVTGATFYVTGVKLEIGNIATPFARQSLAKSMADCQRYYQILDNIITNGYGPASGAMYASFPFPVRMRGQPTAVVSAITYNNGQTLAVNALQPSSLMTVANIVATGPGWAIGTFALSAEI